MSANRKHVFTYCHGNALGTQTCAVHGTRKANRSKTKQECTTQHTSDHGPTNRHDNLFCDMRGTPKRRSAKSQRRATGKISDKGEGHKTRKDSEKDQGEKAVSPLVEDPQVWLKELLIRHPSPIQEGNEDLDHVRRHDLHERTNLVKNRTVKGRMCLSRKICRFELPMDMRELETLSTQDYLRRHCRVSPRRRSHYKKSFDRFDTDRDGLLSLKETEMAVRHLYVDEIATAQLQWLMGITQTDEQSQIDVVLFCALSALSERLLYSVFVTQDMEDRGNGEKELLEVADFCSLLAKLEKCSVRPALRALLLLL